MHQSKVAFFDQVKQGKSAVHVVLGNRDDQAQVMLNHDLPRIEVTLRRECRVIPLLRRRQQGARSDSVQVILRGIAR